MKIHHSGTENTEDAQRKLESGVHPAADEMHYLNTVIRLKYCRFPRGTPQHLMV